MLSSTAAHIRLVLWQYVIHLSRLEKSSVPVRQNSPLHKTRSALADTYSLPGGERARPPLPALPGQRAPGAQHAVGSAPIRGGTAGFRAAVSAPLGRHELAGPRRPGGDPSWVRGKSVCQHRMGPKPGVQDAELLVHSELAQDNASCIKILHVPQLIIAINYLYRYSHFYRDVRIIINNALDMREWMLFYNTLHKKEWFCQDYKQIMWSHFSSWTARYIKLWTKSCSRGDITFL